jgi:hypothetical protein
MIKRYPGWDFICTSKPGSDKAVFDHIDGVQLDSIITNVTNVKTEAGRATWKTSWINGVTITHSKNAMKINFLSLDIIWARNRCAYKHVITKEDGKHFTWITSIEISPENSVGLASFGRARWNIENGTFNLLKNRGMAWNTITPKVKLRYVTSSLV